MKTDNCPHAEEGVKINAFLCNVTFRIYLYFIIKGNYALHGGCWNRNRASIRHSLFLTISVFVSRYYFFLWCIVGVGSRPLHHAHQISV